MITETLASRVVVMMALIGAHVPTVLAVFAAVLLLVLVAHARMCVEPLLVMPAAIFVSGVPPLRSKPPFASFWVAPTFAAMANNRDAASPDPWTERRMEDWLLEGHNAWSILGIAPQSSIEVVVRAFRRLSIRFHKNSHKSPEERAEAAEAYLRISQARDVLTHPRIHDDLLARQHYDGAWSDDAQPEDPVDDSDESTESFNWEDPWHRSNQGSTSHENDPWNDAGPSGSTSQNSSVGPVGAIQAWMELPTSAAQRSSSSQRTRPLKH